MTTLKFVFTCCTATVLLVAGLSLFKRAERSNLADSAIAKLYTNGFSVYQRIGKLFVGRCQKVCRRGTGDSHLLCGIGLMKMLQVVQPDHFIFVGTEEDFHGRIDLCWRKGMMLGKRADNAINFRS